MKLVVNIPVHTRTPGNSRRSWRVEWREAKLQRQTAHLAALAVLNALSPAERAAFKAASRCVVRVTRFSTRRLDTANVLGAVKHVLDGVLNDAVGVDDGSDWYEWTVPSQERGASGVRVTLEAAT